MNRFIIIFLIPLFLFSCNQDNTDSLKTNFTKQEKEILKQAKEIIKSSYYGTLITLDKKGQPKARVMEPFAPDNEFIVWMATNPKSRKVNQLKKNSKATMHYFDKTKMGYVSLMGNAYIVNDDKTKKEKWKNGWEKFYPNKTDGFMLIKFVPNTLELINISKGFTGDSVTWKPHQVILRK
jgi:general stress protein 26